MIYNARQSREGPERSREKAGVSSESRAAAGGVSEGRTSVLARACSQHLQPAGGSQQARRAAGRHVSRPSCRMYLLRAAEKGSNLGRVASMGGVARSGSRSAAAVGRGPKQACTAHRRPPRCKPQPAGCTPNRTQSREPCFIRGPHCCKPQPTDAYRLSTPHSQERLAGRVERVFGDQLNEERGVDVLQLVAHGAHVGGGGQHKLRGGEGGITSC